MTDKRYIYVVQQRQEVKKSLTERELTRKDIMQTAQKTQNDEFYTRYEDIEKEISMYNTHIWKDKVVLCNCNDSVDSKTDDERKSSAFALFFIKNFIKLQIIKSLWATIIDQRQSHFTRFLEKQGVFLSVNLRNFKWYNRQFQ